MVDEGCIGEIGGVGTLLETVSQANLLEEGEEKEEMDTGGPHRNLRLQPVPTVHNPSATAFGTPTHN
jgi:hypothetical protein